MGYGNISAVLSPETKASIKQKVDGIKADMAFLINLTVDERKRLRPIGPFRLGYATEVNVTSNAHTPALAADFDLVEYNKDKTLLTELADVYVWISSLKENIESTMMALGNEVMKQSDLAYDYLKIHAKKTNNENLVAAVNRIKEIMKQTKKDDQ